MITHDTKTSSTPQGLASLLLGSSSKEGADGFAALLESLQTKGDEKAPASTLLLKLDEKAETKDVKSEILSLLKGDETETQMKTDIGLLDPKLTQTLSTKELVQLVHNAKAFLKEQITKVSDTQETPKTLKGLLDLAKKVGIDVSQIKIESVVVKHDAPQIKQATLSQEALSKNTPQEVKPLDKQLPLEKVQQALSQKEVMPQARTEHTTAEIVQAKQKVEAHPEKEAKKERSNPLRSLLQISNNEGEKVVSDNVAPTKVAKQPLFNQALTKLLQGGTSSSNNESDLRTESDTKPTPIINHTQKTDALTQKVVEGKQMVQHFASQLKEEVENYKPPFTRIKMKLNPIKLGEVDVTMVQRGNNVHINISSNSAALNVLLQNAGDLKTQLSNNGITNASMTFNSNADQQQQQQQQQNQQNRQQELMEMYENFENSDEFDLISSLDIVIPRYI